MQNCHTVSSYKVSSVSGRLRKSLQVFRGHFGWFNTLNCLWLSHSLNTVTCVYSVFTSVLERNKILIVSQVLLFLFQDQSPSNTTLGFFFFLMIFTVNMQLAVEWFLIFIFVIAYLLFKNGFWFVTLLVFYLTWWTTLKNDLYRKEAYFSWASGDVPWRKKKVSFGKVKHKNFTYRGYY